MTRVHLGKEHVTPAKNPPEQHPSDGVASLGPLASERHVRDRRMKK